MNKYRVKLMGLEEYQALAACAAACPVRTDAKGYAKAIAEGDFARAYLVARQANPLASVCSRVCQAQCESACRKGEVGTPVAMRALKRFACDQHGVQRGDAAAEKSRKARGGTEDRAARVAIIGSGPAGLAAAHDLALLGYEVTIFESAPIPGGMLRMGIPEFRLPREVVQQEIEDIVELGVKLRLNCSIGRERSLADLREEGFGAIMIAIGLQDPLLLNLENAGLEGVYNGITFLRDYRQLPVGEVCLVIGGGGVAIDCAQLALRRGAKEVTVASLESWEAMPAGASEKEDAREEGIRFYPGQGPKRIVGREGHVRGVEFLEVDSVFDEQGNFNPTLRPHTETMREADTVIVAVGQTSALSDLHGMGATPEGTIRVGADLSTSVPGVFAAGDIRAGQARSVVDAVADGQSAARSIHGYLTGKRGRIKKKGFMKVLDPGFENPGSKMTTAVKPRKRPVEERLISGDEIDLPYSEEQARQEAARCQQCNIQTVFNRRLCILCGACVDGCVPGALKMVRLEDIQGDADVEELTETLKRTVRHEQGMTAMIKDESRCDRCGVCARRCPTEAITMEVFHCEEEWEYE